jgi:hypothetical protein
MTNRRPALTTTETLLTAAPIFTAYTAAQVQLLYLLTPYIRRSEENV